MSVEDMTIRCPDCRGTGNLGIDDRGRKMDCTRCANTGLAPAVKCKSCKGNPYRACKECGTLYLHCDKCNGIGIVPK